MIERGETLLFEGFQIDCLEREFVGGEVARINDYGVEKFRFVRRARVRFRFLGEASDVVESEPRRLRAQLARGGFVGVAAIRGGVK